MRPDKAHPFLPGDIVKLLDGSRAKVTSVPGMIQYDRLNFATAEHGICCERIGMVGIQWTTGNECILIKRTGYALRTNHNNMKKILSWHYKEAMKYGR